MIIREMKDSGISWVGKIPENWNIKKIKLISYIINGNGFSVELQGFESGDYPFCKASDISNAGKYLDKAANYVTFDIVRDQHYNIIPKGAILFPIVGFNDCMEISRIYDKRNVREVIPSGKAANRLVAFEDYPRRGLYFRRACQLHRIQYVLSVEQRDFGRSEV